MVLTRNVGDVHQLLSPKLGELHLLGLVHPRFLIRMSLLGTVDDGLPEPLGIHGGEEAEEVLLFWLAVAFTTPGVWDIAFELGDVLDLLPHVGDGELRPL